MKHTFALVIAILLATAAHGQAPREIKLDAPDKTRGHAVMHALSLRASSREMDEKALSHRDLSDLLWAAYGINRPDDRRTAPTARNVQDIILYACFPDATYLYDAEHHRLTHVLDGDLRPVLASGQDFVKRAPLVLLIVSDYSLFKLDNVDQARLWSGMDGGIVSQNISLFCASVGLCTVPRAYMDQTKLRDLLGLTATQLPILNNPVGYPLP
jgi:nitroreductase